ncbi:glycosyl hydrolase family 18 protein [Paenibacillus sp. 1001270B_150601_E10]|uniref:glycosyl hydrolase family 18 protein n=1 Tax=Paenibacillus sp. 1001270B_150601_E10 TaxID=2787079 RepID=UPI001E2BDFA0|nr:glycosyl hydrolase family 18 protein [Paenibacillus sp. 1001270B_150601_E10]
MNGKQKRNIKKMLAMTVMAMMLFVSSLAPAYASTTSSEARDTRALGRTTNEIRNVMYYGDWSIWGGQGYFMPKDIPADQLTHLNYAFLDFNSSGELIFTDEGAAVGAPVGQAGVQWDAANAGILIALQQLRAENPNLKLGISLGGWSKSGDFSVVAADPAKRAHFVDNVISFIQYTNMDFVDVDWEFPAEVRKPDLVDNKNDEGALYSTPEDKNNYILLLQDFRHALDKLGAEMGRYYELTVALPAPKDKIDVGIDVQRLFSIVDFANIMTYDMRGAWDEYSGHQTGLYPNPLDPLKGRHLSIDESVNYLLQQGAQPNQIVIGAAYYTRGWNSVFGGPDSNLPGLFGEAALNAKDADQTPSRGAISEAPLAVGDGGRATGIWSFRNLDKLKAQFADEAGQTRLQEYWDDIAKAPYLYDKESGAFFTYDNERSIQEKTNYVLEKGLGGVIAWMASNDAPTTVPNKRDQLTKATKQGLFGSEKLKEHEIAYTSLNVTADVTPYQESWGNGKGYEITISNQETLSEQSNVLRKVERGAETIKLPKLYIKADGAFTSGDWLAGTVMSENGYTVVDLKSVYNGKTIEPGASYTFKIKGDAAVESIELVQRVSDNSPEMNRQFIYGDDEPSKNQAPVLNGVIDKTIKVGEAFDKLAGVTATDREDGDLTHQILVIGEVNTKLPGQYRLTYSVADAEGAVTVKDRMITVQSDGIPDYDFGVGQGIEWPKQVNAPFVDMVAWVTKPGYSNNGAANLVQIAQDTGVKYFNLGFIQATSSQLSDGKIQWGWGGYSVLNEKNNNNDQYQGIKKSIRELREMGGDVTISLGGLNGTTFWQVTQDVDTLFRAYLELVQGYGLTHLDLDIEGGAQDKAINVANAKAIKKLQDATGVEIILTLPVLPSGLTQVQLDVLEAYLANGVDVKIVNIMTMCYGNGTLLPGENYGSASLRAVDSTKDQLKSYFQKYANVSLTDAEAYAKIGTTPSIGFEGAAHPIFTTEWTQWVVDHANEKGLGMTSFWSMNRDAMLESNAGVHTQYEFTSIFKQFGEGSTPPANTKPVIHGAADKTIIVGEVFDPRAGVTATDREDGDLTDKINIEGTVDPSTPGTYTLVYSVTDGEGLVAEAIRTITVVLPVNQPPVIHGAVDIMIKLGDAFDPRKGVSASDAEDGDLTASLMIEGIVDTNTKGTCRLVYSVIDSQGATTVVDRTITVTDKLQDTWDPNKIYLVGDTVIFNGYTYTAKWWVQGQAPGTTDAWEKEKVLNEDGSVDYEKGSVYVQGDLVRYEGKLYLAKWWTQSAPGSDSSWELVQ